MQISRRKVLGTSAFLVGAAGLRLPAIARAAQIDTSALTSITGNAVAIGRDERAARLDRARGLMAANDIAAIVLEPGSSMVYFTGVRWGRSERLTAAVIPATGMPFMITPFFERPSVAESLEIDADIHVWQEDESPTALFARELAARGLRQSRIGIEETVRFFASDGLAHAMPDARIVSADAVVRGCRMRKTAPEIALMHVASEVTKAAYEWTVPQIREGMTNREISALMDAATRALGGTPEFSMVLIDEASAYPHGTGKPQIVRPGSTVLFDCGCSVEDYQSDISRTVFSGEPDPAAMATWHLVREGQNTAFAAAQLGQSAGSVDDAVRALYESKGLGPRYRLPGLSHRTGHGIGMDGHEPVNLVHGEATKLDIGMCFSNEPGIYYPGRFGVRQEDCFYMTEKGPCWFTEPSAEPNLLFGARQ
ncbi:aminopeptidase P family protein [Tsuneonella suprasediminis]|uniref:Aminopeptidase P family protein n=1 Tax=Tsuneonella suprasediminis TaxID=2306996 RepID=A0A419QZS7_9SPHN|nr:Xaa-Pro peptidase family protein [Tsuneonella suprasediminis]RJX66762.1 aminopeptidase P family protein [Tsuneonella suprasediminis]